MSASDDCNCTESTLLTSLLFLDNNSGCVNFIMSVLYHLIKTFDSVLLAKWQKFKNISRSGELKAHTVTNKYYHALRIIATKITQQLSSSILILIHNN